MIKRITHHDRGALIQGGVIIEHGLAKLSAEYMADRFTGETEGRFVMRGPSGVHTLMILTTDAERLNAHWQVFAADPRNAAQMVAV